MPFGEILEQVITLLKRQGRVSYRALKMRFDIDDEYLHVLKEEILFAYPVSDEDSRGLVWTDETRSPESDIRRGSEDESHFHAMLSAVMWWLQRDGRVTYRTLKHILGLNNALLDEIREELTLRRLAIDEDCKVLVWTGEPQPVTSPVVDIPSQITIVSTPSPSLRPVYPLMGRQHRQTPSPQTSHRTSLSPHLSHLARPLRPNGVSS